MLNATSEKSLLGPTEFIFSDAPGNQASAASTSVNCVGCASFVAYLC